MRQPHPTVRTTIKEADVDEKIAPVVRWLNSYESVITEYCCQGDDEDKCPKCKQERDGTRPYVLFYCHDSLDLAILLNQAQFYSDTVVEFYRGSVRYNMRFYSAKHLAQFARAKAAGTSFPAS